jgi:hypothetical protein
MAIQFPVMPLHEAIKVPHTINPNHEGDDDNASYVIRGRKSQACKTKGLATHLLCRLARIPRDSRKREEEEERECKNENKRLSTS